MKDVLNGLNAAVFAYGATGSGKTHTMLGPNKRRPGTNISGTPLPPDHPPRTATNGSVDGDASSADNGLMVRAIDEIFEHFEMAEEAGAFKVCSMYILFFTGVGVNFMGK